MDTTRVAISVSQLKVTTARHLLSEAGIESFVIDKTDSAYSGLFGTIELYVDKEKEAAARKILEDNDVFKEE